MRRLVLQYLLTLLTLFGGAVAIAQFKAEYFSSPQIGDKVNLITVEEGNREVFIAAESDERVGLLILGAFACVFLGESLYYRLKWGRDARYAAALELINKAFG